MNILRITGTSMSTVDQWKIDESIWHFSKTLERILGRNYRNSDDNNTTLTSSRRISPWQFLYFTAHWSLWRRNISSICSSPSEAFASEWLEHIERFFRRYYMHSDASLLQPHNSVYTHYYTLWSTLILKQTFIKSYLFRDNWLLKRPCGYSIIFYKYNCN